MPQRIELSDRPRIARRARVRFDARTQRHLLLSPERALVLNETASRIVLGCTGGQSVSQICAQIAGSEPADSVAEDVLAFLERLRDRRLIELGRPS